MPLARSEFYFFETRRSTNGTANTAFGKNDSREANSSQKGRCRLIGSKTSGGAVHRCGGTASHDRQGSLSHRWRARFSGRHGIEWLAAGRSGSGFPNHCEALSQAPSHAGIATSSQCYSFVTRPEVGSLLAVNGKLSLSSYYWTSHDYNGIDITIDEGIEHNQKCDLFYCFVTSLLPRLKI